ncbi:MAG TPA: hypothetical protein VNT20_06915 [Flavisolibacter sp.]|nr:hypothetical protein [Flavisolibacter sp.]
MKESVLLFLGAAVLFSCDPGSKSTQNTVERETVSSVRKYEYVDPLGKRLIIQNSWSRGIQYVDPDGKKENKVLFWTRITNETENPLELNIDFPVEYEVPSLSGKYFKILLPPDTMALAKEPLTDYGITDLKSFLDNNIHKPSSLKRTINPKESGGFYVAILFDEGVSGPFRTGLSIKGQNLIYKVTRYTGKQGLAFVDEKGINCGSINLKNLVRQKTAFNGNLYYPTVYHKLP